MSDANPPVIVLVRPQLGENIGKAARAMLNFGLTDLRLVSPRDGWPNPAAGPAASGADVVLERARVFDTVADAVADRGRSLQLADLTPESLHAGLDRQDVARTCHASEADAFDAPEEDQLVSILGLRQDEDRPDLGNRLGDDGRRQRRRLARLVGQVLLGAGDVLHPDDPAVGFALRHPVHEQEREPVRQNPFDGRGVER